MMGIAILGLAEEDGADVGGMTGRGCGVAGGAEDGISSGGSLGATAGVGG